MKAFSRRALMWGAALACAAALASVPALAQKAAPVSDPIRVLKIPKGAPIHIAVFTVLSGPDVGQGLDPYRGIQIASEDMGGKILGHPVKFSAEDDGCSAEGGQTAGSKIAANQNVVIALGSNCSSATIPAVPLLWRQGIPVISMGAASPKLTAGAGTDGFSRVIFNALFQGEALAEWTRNVKKFDRVAGIHDGTPYVEGLVRAFTDRFKAMGGDVVAIEAVGPQDVDMRPMLTRLATTKPQMVFFPTFIATTAHIVRQAKQMDDFKNVMLLGSDNVADRNFLQVAGSSAVGFTIIAAPLDTESQGPAYKKLLDKYRAKYGEGPQTPWAGYGYDAFLVAAKAIEKVAVQDKDATYIPASKLQAAIRATKDLKGITGNITCRPNGDCNNFRAVFYQFADANPDTFEMGKNPKSVK